MHGPLVSDKAGLSGRVLLLELPRQEHSRAFPVWFVCCHWAGGGAGRGGAGRLHACANEVKAATEVRKGDVEPGLEGGGKGTRGCCQLAGVHTHTHTSLSQLHLSCLLSTITGENASVR